MSQYGAEGAARQGLGARADRAVLLPAHHGRHRRRHGPGADHAPTPTTTRRSWPGPGLGCATSRAARPRDVPTTGAAGQGHAVADSAGDAAAATKVSYRTDAWHMWRRSTATASSAPPAAAHASCCRSQPVTYRGTLQSRRPDRAPGAAPDHGQQGLARGLRPGRRPARDAGVVAPGGAARAGDRGPHLCGVRGRRTPPTRVCQLCDTTSCQVYGGKSAEYPSTNEATAKTAGQVRTVPRRSRRSPSSPPATAAGPATAASRTSRQAGPVRRVVGQPRTTPGRTTVGLARDREGLAGPRQPDRRSPSTSATATASGTAGSSDDPARQQGRPAPHRRRLPLALGLRSTWFTFTGRRGGRSEPASRTG